MAEAEAVAAKKVTLKLLIDKKNDVVLFAEAGKDFVDFLFHILALPVGTVIRLLGKKGMVGSLGNLYDSIEALNDTYCIQPSSGNASSFKESLLRPRIPTYCGSTASSDVPLLLPPELTSSVDFELTYYRCPSTHGTCRNYVSLSPSAACPYCKVQMNHKATLVEVTAAHKSAAAEGSAETGGSGEGGGYVKGVVTYMVMEDLVVKPMSTISSITLLNKFNVADLNCLEERVVNFGMDEGVALLKAALQSKTVLTDVFLAGKKKRAH